MPEPISGLFFALHTFCNFNCKYCWQKNSPSLKLNTKLDLKLVDMIIDDFFENYILLLPSSTKFEIVFSGGEGLFFFDELMHYITKIRGYSNILSFSPEIVIQTNGSLLDARKIDFLANNRVSLYFSFDGAGQNTTR